jgi:hypothetical protein
MSWSRRSSFRDVTAVRGRPSVACLSRRCWNALLTASLR